MATRGYTNKGKNNYRGRTGYGRKRTQKFNPRSIISGGDALADLKKSEHTEWFVNLNHGTGLITHAEINRPETDGVLDDFKLQSIPVTDTKLSGSDNKFPNAGTMLLNCPIRFRTSNNLNKVTVCGGKKMYARSLNCDLTFSAVGKAAGDLDIMDPINVDVSVVLLNGSFKHCLGHSGVSMNSNDCAGMGLKRVFNIYHKRFVLTGANNVYKLKLYKEFNRSLTRSGVGNTFAASVDTLIEDPDSEITDSEAPDHQRLGLLIKSSKHVTADKAYMNISGFTKWVFYEQ
jgi:hypothetical protein